MASDSLTETSSYNLTDRALWDSSSPGAKLVFPHPVAGRPWAERDWNRRESACFIKDEEKLACFIKDAEEVSSRIKANARSILAEIGFALSDDDILKALQPGAPHKPKPSLSRFNREAMIDWSDLSHHDCRLFVAEFSDETWALAIDGDAPVGDRFTARLKAAGFTRIPSNGAWVRPVPMPEHRAARLKAVLSSEADRQPELLAEAGFTQRGAEWDAPWLPMADWFTHAEIQEIFPAAVWRPTAISDCMAELPFPAPFKTVLIEDMPADGREPSKRVAAIIPLQEGQQERHDARPLGPQISAKEAISLIEIAAILHVGDVRLEAVQPQAVSGFFKSLLGLARMVEGVHIVDPQTPLGLFSHSDLESFAAILGCYEKVLQTYNTAVGSVSMRWLAASNFEARCLAEGLRPELVEEPLEPWPLPELIERYEREVAEHRRVREIEREVCRAVRKLDDPFTDCNGPGMDMIRFPAAIREIDLPKLVETAECPLREGSKEVYLAGPETANIRLAWDCLAIWLEAHPEEWPSKEETSPFGRFVNAVHQTVADVTAKATEKSNKANGKSKEGGLSKRPISKALLAFLEQETYIGIPPVAVIDPVLAPDDRFMRYLRPPSIRGSSLAGPSLWRQREKRSIATTRN